MFNFYDYLSISHSVTIKIFCVSCYKVLQKLTLCNNKCKFPICAECQHSGQHRIECELIRSWKLKNENIYSKHLFRALTVIRGLLLSDDDRKLMLMMACHENTALQNLEVEKILDEFDALTADSDVVTQLKKISSILNTNAFELGLPHDDKVPEHGISLRVSRYALMYICMKNKHESQVNNC